MTTTTKEILCGECKQGYDDFGCLGCSHDTECSCMECDTASEDLLNRS